MGSVTALCFLDRSRIANMVPLYFQLGQTIPLPSPTPPVSTFFHVLLQLSTRMPDSENS